MKTQFRRRFLSFLLSVAALCSFVASPIQAQAQTVLTYTGIWVSAGCEARPGAPYARREFTIEGSKFEQKLTIFNDSGCAIPRLRLRVLGNFAVTGASFIAPGAGEVQFTWRKAYLTTLTTSETDNFNDKQAGLCGLLPYSTGAEQDIEVTRGCRWLSIDMRTTFIEYDLAVVSGGQLFFGARPIDGGYARTPDRRPIAFGSPLNKRRDIVLDTVPLTPILPLLPETGAVSRK